MEQSIILTRPAFCEGGRIPRQHTGFWADLSPELHVENISPDARSLALTMDDLDIPMVGEFNHWLLWNIPPVTLMPESLPSGTHCLNGAVQGMAGRATATLGRSSRFSSAADTVTASVSMCWIRCCVCLSPQKSRSCWSPWRGIFCKPER